MGTKVVAFGEIMLRLKSPDHERLFQSSQLEASFGGGEANVATSLALLGAEVSFVSVLPKNSIADACVQYLHGLRVDTSHIIHSGPRIGIYFLEAGNNQRASRVIYDRAHSSLADANPILFDWDEIFDGAGWFHITGITPALSANAARISLQAVQAAREKGLTISCDYNYRKNLWKYGKSAPQIMQELVRYADVGIANEEDCQLALGIQLDDPGCLSGLDAGLIDREKYRLICEKVLAEFPNLKCQAITLRESFSASCNSWSACLHDRRNFYLSPQYRIDNIVDRVGTGDAFSAGLIFGMLNNMGEQAALNFATAASCLKHTIPGDINLSTLEEVQQLANGDGSGRIQR
jgi:2-dehydro-3-deoxygluconokinase